LSGFFFHFLVSAVYPFVGFPAISLLSSNTSSIPVRFHVLPILDFSWAGGCFPSRYFPASTTPQLKRLSFLLFQCLLVLMYQVFFYASVFLFLATLGAFILLDFPPSLFFFCFCYDLFFLPVF